MIKTWEVCLARWRWGRKPDVLDQCHTGTNRLLSTFANLVRLKVGRSWQFMRSLKMHGSREEIKKLAPQCRRRGSVWRDPRSQQPEISNLFLLWPSLYGDPSILCRLNEPFAQKSRPILNRPIQLVTFAFSSPLFDTYFFNRPNYHISFANCVKQIICSPP